MLFDIPGLAVPPAFGCRRRIARSVAAFEQLGRAAAALAAQRRDQQPFEISSAAHDWPGGLIGPRLEGRPPLVLSVYDARRGELVVRSCARARRGRAFAVAYAASITSTRP